MQKPLTLLLFLFAIVLCFVSSSDVFSQLKVENEGVESVSFDKEKVTLACPWVSLRSKQPCPPEDRKIMVSTISPNAEKNSWNYYYFVTGGKIIGEGANVVWDFTGVRPGDYLITIGVGKDGVIKGNYVSKMVVAYSCENCHPTCSCPGISVTGPTAVAKRGDTLIFTAEVRGSDQSRIEYNWTVSDGTIVFGQGTKQILVLTSPNMKANSVTATFEVRGICADCTERTVSATVKIK